MVSAMERLRDRQLERWVAGLSVVGGMVHLAAAPQHLQEWWGYGLFFFATALLQVTFGLLIGTRGLELPGGWSKWRRKVYGIGVAGNVALIALWLMTRTVGVPFGPDAGKVEALGWLDLTSKSVEIATLVFLVALLLTTRKSEGRVPQPPPT